MADVQIQLALMLEERLRRANERKLFSYYPDAGPLRRELYPKHTGFFEAGKRFRERLMLAANRVGKTEGVGGYEVAIHMTGRYPDWWEGRRFTKPVSVWVAGDTSKTVRDILQFKLLGPMTALGTGLVPKDDIIKVVSKPGVAEAVEIAMVRHATGGESRVIFKSYDQKRESFQGTEQDIIWLDEEPPLDVYTECVLRTMTTNGMVILTFTPMMGMSETVMAFFPNGEVQQREEGNKYVCTATWDDVPHLDQTTKEELWNSIPPFQRDARSKGIPQLGSGAIYPVPESEIIIPEFEIPVHWPRVFGMDVGWNRTAAVWGAIDRESDTLYLYSEHYMGQAEPAVHAEGLKARGTWIPGVVDPASRGRSQVDGQQLLQRYRAFGLDIVPALNSVETGIYDVWQRLSSGRLKVFRGMKNWLSEFRLYRRDDKGRVVKDNDHLMDATRYLVVSGIRRALTEGVKSTSMASNIIPIINYFGGK
jgi:phage terminase large subunit-like protein